MTTYNGRYRYDLPILTYDGDLIDVDNELVVTSDTYAFLDIIDSAAFGDSLYQLVNKVPFASLDIYQGKTSFASSELDVDINSKYVGFSINSSRDIQFGSITIEQDSKQSGSSEISISSNSFGVSDINLIDHSNYANTNLLIEKDVSANINNVNTSSASFGNIELDLNLDKSAAGDFSITIIPNL